MAVLSSIIIAVLIYSVYDRLQILEAFKDFASKPETPCKLIHGVRGAEDLIKWKDVIFATNLDSYPLWLWGKPTSNASLAEPGSIYVLSNLDSDNEVLEKASILNYPPNVVMHSHGIGLLHSQDLLFVVNHAYAKGGERVDIFQITKNANQKVELLYQSTVQFDTWMGTLNDIVPVSKDEFYVTNYLPVVDTKEGRPNDFSSKLLRILYSLSQPLFKFTHILYCKGTKGNSDDICKVVGPGAGMWNGITATPDGKTIFVNDLLAKTIYSFSRTASNDLQQVKTYKSEHVLDNIEYMDGKIWRGGLAKLTDSMKFDADYEHHPDYILPSFNQGKSPSGLLNPGHVSSLDLATGNFTTHVVHHGSLLSGFASGIRHKNKVIVGSYYDDGVLICKPDNL
jgi:hypothetical protein